MNWNAPAEANPAMPTLAQPMLDTRTAPLTAESDGDWLCAWCHNPVAKERDRFDFGGKDQFTFRNPEGIRFHIITFSQTLGCRESGVPTLEHTWFPDHAWSYCLCARCGQHLGWYYVGKYSFAGLILDRMVRALFVRN